MEAGLVAAALRLRNKDVIEKAKGASLWNIRSLDAVHGKDHPITC